MGSQYSGVSVHADAAGKFARNFFLRAFYCCCHFAFAFLRGLFIKLATAYLSEDAGFFTGALEATNGDFEGFVIFYTYIWHTNSS